MYISIIDWIVVLIEMATLAYFYKKIFNTAIRNKLPFVVVVGTYGVAGVVIIIMSKLLGPFGLSFVAGMAVFVVAEIIYRGNYHNKLFGALIFSVIQLGAEAVAWCIVTLAEGLIGSYYAPLPTEQYIYGALLSKGVAWLMVIVFTHWQVQKNDINLKAPIYWLLPMLTVFLMYYFIDLTTLVNIKELNIRIALNCIFLVAFNFLVVCLWQRQLHMEQRTQELILKDMAMSNRVQYCEAVEKQNERIQRLRHEIKRYANTFLQLLNHEKVDQAKMFLSNFLEDMDREKTIYAKDVVLNAILTMAHEQAAESACTLETDILFDHPLRIQPQHFVMVLGNCLENAIEAAAQIEVPNNNTVKLAMRTNKSNVFIRVANPVKEKVEIGRDNEIETSKDDKNRHGFGLKNIKEVVKLYDGHITLSCDDQVFVTNIRLNNWADPLLESNK